MKYSPDAYLLHESDKETDILCYGAVVNYGATVDADINALCGIHNMTENSDQQ